MNVLRSPRLGDSYQERQRRSCASVLNVQHRYRNSLGSRGTGGEGSARHSVSCSIPCTQYVRSSGLSCVTSDNVTSCNRVLGGDHIAGMLPGTLEHQAGAASLARRAGDMPGGEGVSLALPGGTRPHRCHDLASFTDCTTWKRLSPARNSQCGCTSQDRTHVLEAQSENVGKYITGKLLLAIDAHQHCSRRLNMMLR
jgi:hypothetical protein